MEYRERGGGGEKRGGEREGGREQLGEKEEERERGGQREWRIDKMRNKRGLGLQRAATPCIGSQTISVLRY